MVVAVSLVVRDPGGRDSPGRGGGVPASSHKRMAHGRGTWISARRCIESLSRTSSCDMLVSLNRGTRYIIILITETPEKVPLMLGTPNICSFRSWRTLPKAFEMKPMGLGFRVPHMGL